MKKLSNNQMASLVGGDFWGSNCTPVSGTQYVYQNSNGTWLCQQQYNCTQYVFWIPFNYSGSGGCYGNYYMNH